ncbi:thermonuclease family protein [Prosthecobacter sp.]|uniref:thermonuclease family protein n=1 Tax=Prosthecobacter sp. TaxID=1965333 RepID=UPI001D1C9BBC|nr:thermonuclease family protein [Prosthecobacter sp.]MCB1276071.1 thermonuclease family protein [Prosthecobacter sp.]
MKRRSNLSRNLWAMVWVIVVLLQVWDRYRDKPAPHAPEPDGHFVELRHVRLIEDAGNDGDSFKIAHDGGANVLRLYFVDCPEKRQYPLINSRLKDQAGYFGGLSIPQTVNVGLEAKAFTETLLRERHFTILTRWERVYDSARSYALVFFDDGEELSEKLVRAGLCRIHTKGTLMPDGRREFDFESHLRALEREAKAAQRGAWGKPKRAPSKSKP